eukprot:2498176-Amphidinium_carterae.5
MDRANRTCKLPHKPCEHHEGAWSDHLGTTRGLHHQRPGIGEPKCDSGLVRQYRLPGAEIHTDLSLHHASPGAGSHRYLVQRVPDEAHPGIAALPCTS